VKIVMAVLHLGKQGMEVVTEQVTPTGPRRRAVSLTWMTKLGEDLPPAEWPALVRGEIDFQDSNRMPMRL